MSQMTPLDSSLVARVLMQKLLCSGEKCFLSNVYVNVFFYGGKAFILLLVGDTLVTPNGKIK